MRYAGAVNRYVVRRVIVTYGAARPAMDALKQALAANDCTVMQALGTGLKKLAVPFFGGTLAVALGAPRLAHETGAALIPVFVVPTGEGGYRVRLGPDLNARTYIDRDSAVRAMAVEYVSLLEAVVHRHPAVWTGWFHPATWRLGQAAAAQETPHPRLADRLIGFPYPKADLFLHQSRGRPWRNVRRTGCRRPGRVSSTSVPTRTQPAFSLTRSEGALVHQIRLFCRAALKPASRKRTALYSLTSRRKSLVAMVWRSHEMHGHGGVALDRPVRL